MPVSDSSSSAILGTQGGYRAIYNRQALTALQLGNPEFTGLSICQALTAQLTGEWKIDMAEYTCQAVGQLQLTA